MMSERSNNAALLSIVLPVYNESGVLDELLQRVHDSAAGCGIRFEIVFVDDGSSDGSGARLDVLAEEHPHVRVVHLARNFGHQAAVQAGLAHARGDAAVLMDSDLQDAPEAIPRFVEAWREGYDVVYAIRVDRKEALWKRLLFTAFHRTLAKVASTRVPRDAGNFSLMDRRVVQRILELGERDRYLPGLRSWVGFRQYGIEIERLARYDDQPRVSLWGLWRLAKTAVFSFSTFPLTVFYVIGYLALALFASLSGFSTYCLFAGWPIPAWTPPVLIGSFFGALNALGISILGEYITRIYDQVRGRPMYLVDRVVESAGEEPETPDVERQLADLLATVQTARLAENAVGSRRDPSASGL